MESENVLGEMLKKLLNPTGNAKDNEAIDKALEETKDFLWFAQEQEGVSSDLRPTIPEEKMKELYEQYKKQKQ